jgi:putative ABC transport system permease protein
MLNWGPPISAAIVGVAGDVVGQELEGEKAPTVYWHYPQFPQLFTTSVFVRTTIDPVSAIADVKRAIWSVEPNLPLPRIESLLQSAETARARRRVLTDLLVGLAIAAAAFCMVGLYGVLLHEAGRNRASHGVRLALGARPVDLAWLVVRDATKTAAMGLAAGVLLSLMTAHAIASLLFQTGATDSLAFGAAIVGCLLVVLAAAIVPAWRTSRIDPRTALAAE